MWAPGRTARSGCAPSVQPVGHTVEYQGTNMFKNQRNVAAIATAVMATFAADVASAACTRLAFSVNDYGKVGPANDAKRLLDPYIKKWANDRGIKTYTVGTKDVSCELFLDFIVFDEYTCKAAATVCWNGPLPKNHEVEAGTPSENKAASRPAAAPKAATGQAPAGAAAISTGSVRPAPAATLKPAGPVVAPVSAPAAAPSAAPVAAPAPAPAAPQAAPAAPPAN